MLYGRDPPGINQYRPGDSTIDAVDLHLQVKEEALQNIKANLERSQQAMKTKANKSRSDIELEVGQWVSVKLKPYRQSYVTNHVREFFGSFQVIKKISVVAYKLSLPEGIRIH